MEKSAATAKRQFSYRLLISLFILFSAYLPLSAEVLNSRQIKDLQVLPQTDTIFTQKDCIFTLTLPGIKLENVRTTLPNLPGGVQFISSRRSDFIDADRDVGTHLEFWFSFSGARTFTIPPLTAVINGRTYRIAFAPVSVYENPASILPKMIIRFTGGMEGPESISDFIFNTAKSDSPGKELHCPAGTKVYLTVYLKYAVQVMKFDWHLQKDSLFQELERYEITKGQPRGTSFSSEEFPVARFEWVPLTAGEWALPDIKITATAYNGSRVELTTPVFSITVTEAAAVEPVTARPQKDDSVFAYAFTESKDSVTEKKIVSFSVDECKKLAQLRSAERNAFPFSRESAIRTDYEKSLGISADIAEPSVPVLYVCLGCIFVFLLLAVVLLIKKNKVFISFLILSFVFLIITVIQGAKLKDAYAVFTGGVLSPIPEKSSSASQNETGGKRVKILEKTEDWVYIVYNGTGGWVPKDSVFIIK